MAEYNKLEFSRVSEGYPLADSDSFQEVRNLLFSIDNIYENSSNEDEILQANATANSIYECYMSHIYPKVYYTDEDIIVDDPPLQRKDIIRLSYAKPVPSDPVEICIHNILNVEQSYIKTLTLMEDNFMEPLAKVLTRREMEIIFYGIKELNQIHQQILRELENEVGSQKNKTTLHVVFKNWKDKLIIYEKYGKNFPKALSLICAIYKKRKDISNEVELIQAKMNDRLKLTNGLRLPILHIINYSALLEALREKIPAEHKDHSGLESAAKAMFDLSERVKAIEKDSFIIQDLKQVQLTIQGWEKNTTNKTPLKEYGRLFKRGVLKVVSSDVDSFENYKYYVFLFSRYVVFCTSRSVLLSRPRNAQFTFRYRLKLQNCIFEESVGISSSSEEQTIPWTHSWRLMGPTGRKNIMFYAETAQDRASWIRCFGEVMTQLHPRFDANSDAATHKFQLETYNSATNCQVCHEPLLGLLNQGYHCNKCDGNFHKKCLKISRKCYTDGDDIYCTTAEYQHMPESLTSQEDSDKSENEEAADSLSNLDIRKEGNESPCYTDSATSFELNLGPQLFPRQEIQDYTVHHIHVENNGDRRLFKTNFPELESQPWYAGSISADQTARLLEGTPPGTFLIRSRTDNTSENQAPYALSIRVAEVIWHVRVLCNSLQKDEDLYSQYSRPMEYFFDPKFTFNSIHELVNWYTTHLLSEVIPQLHLCLGKPYRQAILRA